MIRDAKAQDADQIAEIYNYYIRETVISFEEETVNGAEILSRIEKTQKAGLAWLVALEQGKVVGYAYASKWNDRAAYRHTVEVSVYLSHLLRSKGWGTKLYQELFSRLRNQDIHTVIGGITLPNEASVALHEKFGMQQVAHFKEVGFKLGQWLDVGYWQASL